FAHLGSPSGSRGLMKNTHTKKANTTHTDAAGQKAVTTMAVAVTNKKASLSKPTKARRKPTAKIQPTSAKADARPRPKANACSIVLRSSFAPPLFRRRCLGALSSICAVSRRPRGGGCLTQSLKLGTFAVQWHGWLRYQSRSPELHHAILVTTTAIR